MCLYLFKMNENLNVLIPNNINEARYLIHNFRDENGTTILMWASYYKLIELVRLCLEFGVDKNQKNNYGTTALEMAMDRENNDIIVNLLK